MPDHFAPRELHLNKFGKGPLGYIHTIPHVKHISQEVLKKIFEHFSMYLYGLNLGPPGKEPSWILGPSFEPNW